MINLSSSFTLRVIALIILILTLIVYYIEHSGGYDGPYNPDGSYSNITAVKHDVYKSLFVSLFVYLIVGKINFSSFPDFLNSWVGQNLVAALSYFVFHILLQPYVVNYLPNF